MATSMQDILSDAPEEKPEPAAEPEAKEPAAPAAEAAEKPEAPERAQSRRKEHQRKEWAAQGRDPETGQFTSKKEEATEEPKAPEAAAAPAPEVKAEAKPVEEMTPKEKAAFAAAADERRKRQALEQELARLRGAAPQQPAPAAGQPPAQPKGFWEDPEGAFKTEEQKRQQHEVRTKLQVSELIARNKYQDFDEKIAKFAELVQQTPGLGQQWLAAQDPGEFAYTAAKNHMLLEQAGNLDNLRSEIEAKARADERAKVEAEFKKREEEAKLKRAALTPSLSDVQGAGRKPQAQWTGPTPMSDILK